MARGGPENRGRHSLQRHTAAVLRNRKPPVADRGVLQEPSKSLGGVRARHRRRWRATRPRESGTGTRSPHATGSSGVPHRIALAPGVVSSAPGQERLKKTATRSHDHFHRFRYSSGGELSTPKARVTRVCAPPTKHSATVSSTPNRGENQKGLYGRGNCRRREAFIHVPNKVR